MKKTIIALFLFTFSFAFMSITGFAEDEFTAPTCKEYIRNNFSSFVYNVNQILDGDNQIVASSINYEKDMFNITSNVFVTFFDFDESNGFVVADDENIYMIDNHSELGYINNDNIYFSEYDGFVYLTSDGYVKYDLPETSEFDELANYGLYNGQDGTIDGSGKIRNPIDYIQDRYGSGYVLYSDITLGQYVNVRQNDYVVYLPATGNNAGEGNCTLSAMYGILRYLRDYKNFSNLPTSSMFLDPSTDSFYNTFVPSLYISNARYVPEIYSVIREYAKNYGYQVSSTFHTSSSMASICNDVLEYYGYNRTYHRTFANLYFLWSFETNVKGEIDMGYPTMWNTLRGQYGAHSMVVKGYRIYKKEVNFLWFTIKYTKTLMLLNDNSNSIVDYYFDLNAYAYNFSEMFGTFLKVRDSCF